jgi:hypothetical protein
MENEMAIGFKGFAKPKTVSGEIAKGMLDNLGGDEFVVWTGGTYSMRRASGRSACLRTLTEKGKPVKLADYVNRCFKAASDGKGYGTDISVGGLSLHQGAKPAVYLYLVRDSNGNFRAKKDIPTPDPTLGKKSFKAGEIVISAKPKKEKAPKAPKEPQSEGNFEQIGDGQFRQRETGEVVTNQ